MFELFKIYLSKRATFNDRDFDLLQSFSLEKKLRKQEFLLHEGEICDYVIFVTKGLLRLFKIGDNGNEYIFRFSVENSWMSDRESYSTGKPSGFNIEAIENSEVMIWKKENFVYLLKEIPALKELMRSLILKNQIATQKRIYSHISNSVEENYLQFIETQSAIFSRVPLYMVASYLGVTPKTLSRIRRQFADRK